jgi:hypothetical protein
MEIPILQYLIIGIIILEVVLYNTRKSKREYIQKQNLYIRGICYTLFTWAVLSNLINFTMTTNSDRKRTFIYTLTTVSVVLVIIFMINLVTLEDTGDGEQEDEDEDEDEDVEVEVESPTTPSPPTSGPPIVVSGPAPVNCEGEWVDIPGRECSEPCDGGKISKKYKITRKAKNGGKPCPFIKNSYKIFDCNQQRCPGYESTPSIGENDECREPGTGKYYVFTSEKIKIRNSDPYNWSNFSETYLGKVFSSDTDTCVRTINDKEVNFSINDKYCLTNQSNTYQYSYSFGGTSNNGIYDKNLCADKDKCLYVAYTQVEGGVPCKLGDICRSIRNARGEHLLDRMVEEVWCDKINPDHFYSVPHMEVVSGTGIVKYKDTAPPPYTSEFVKPNDILLTRLEEYTRTTDRADHYNLIYQILIMLLVMKKYNIEKPSRVYCELSYAVPSS